MSDLTPETVAEALSRKPIEGHTQGRWMQKSVMTSIGRAYKVNTPGAIDDKHGLIACIYDDHTTLNERPHMEHEANARLIATAPDLQDENQTLAALCRQQHEAIEMLLHNNCWTNIPMSIRRHLHKSWELMPQGESDA